MNNHKEFGIRIVNVSLGGDELCEKGIVIVAAAGNDENGSISPPANSLNVIAVGGVNDNNNLEVDEYTAYHSSYGKTVDELMKPELVVQAIWIAAPILPFTKEHQEARLCIICCNNHILY